MIHTCSLDIVDSCEYGIRVFRLKGTNVNHRAPSLGLYVEANCVLCLAVMRGKEANNGLCYHFAKYIRSCCLAQVTQVTVSLGYSPRTMVGRGNKVQKHIHC